MTRLDRGAAFDVEGLLRGLDAIFAEHRGATDAEPHLRAGLARAEQLGDHGARLSILNELAGLYRSLGRHAEAIASAEAALTLADELGLEGSDAYATTLINAATALRAAGRHERALDTYTRALDAARVALGHGDRRLAALHNNLSILHSEGGNPARAAVELRAALAILEGSSLDPAGDIDIAATLTNLSLVEHELGRHDEAEALAGRSLAIFRSGGHEGDPHFAAAVAGQAEASFRMGRLAEAVDLYRRALAIVAECYGEGSDAYAITAENLAQAEAAAEAAATAPRAAPPVAPPAAPPVSPAVGQRVQDSGPILHQVSHSEREQEDRLPGLELARAFWEEHGRPMLEARYPSYRGRIAAGLVGHGSECYGFDDAWSRDHDFGPGFCLWLTAEDHAEIGAALQADYEALPREFRGHGPRRETPRAQGAGRRVGVFEIGAFFEAITGHASAPDRPHEWLMLEEATLAAATNGAVFADPLGAFSAVRNGFRRMPDDVRLALIARRLGMVAQAGQYNVPRMLARGDGQAAWLAVAEFVRAAGSLVFLLNGPNAAGYLPYYKWQPAALRALAARMGSRLPEVAGELGEVARLSSAACFGGAGFGEGGGGARPAREALEAAIERVCARVVGELNAQGLSRSDATFLEHQRAPVQARIGDDWLRGL